MATENHATFFDRFPKTFSAVDILDVNNLLEFGQNIVTFCEMQGAALYPVKSDVNGNIVKIRNSCENFDVWTVEEMLARENEANIAKKDSSGSVGLLWLSRGVELIIESLAELVRNPDEKMSNLVKIAYEKTLRPYHNRVMSLIFSGGLKMFPDTKTFLLKLAYNKPDMEEEVMVAMNDFLQTYGQILEPIQMMLAKYDIGDKSDILERKKEEEKERKRERSERSERKYM
ncbi:unnamed protein product [Hymenolepis diminuta]|uniref:Glycolipid transfer protein domain-containing protein n=1 Tax=Hymenolepis diminuta TaxID=6216 RepID=A0A564YF71_HYMDI|nr:unnamed protein product [Hymenolepis diminuta]